MIARADVELKPPILLSERGDGAPESMIVTGIASAADVLSYADGDDEITDGARRDTAEQLRGVPLVSPEDHQRWQEAQPVVPHKTVGLDASLVFVEAQVRVQARHAHVDKRFAQLVVGVRTAKAGFVPHPVGQLDDVDVVVVARSAGHGDS
jgi:hypothetical protein